MISLIIPLYNSNYIEKQLLSIKNIDKDDLEYEIIFIDDWSDEEFVIKYKKDFELFKEINLSYYYLWDKNWKNRVCEARNIWAKFAKYDNLIFIDQETILHKTYLTFLKKYFFEDQIVFWQSLWYNNNVKSLSDEDIDFFIENSTIDKDNFSDFRFYFYKEKEDQNRIWEFFSASNFFISKKIFTKIWWFDENLLNWWDEDIEFWYRLSKAWYNIKFLDKMKVLNLSEKLYREPYKILEKEKVNSLSTNWLYNYNKHKTVEYKRYILDRFLNLNYLEKLETDILFQKKILNHSFYKTNKFGKILFRVDDVYELTDNFKKVIGILILYKTPFVLWIEPANIDTWIIDYLKKLKDTYPDLIDLVQHGYKHKNYSDSNFQYEFWKNRDYLKQNKDIKEWKKIINSNFWNLFLNAFIPPYNNYDKNTEKSLNQLWFDLISSWYPVPFSLEENHFIDIPFFVDLISDYENKKFYTISEIINSINYYIDRDWFAWILIHPQYFDYDNFKLLIELLNYLKKKSHEFINFSDFLNKYRYE